MNCKLSIVALVAVGALSGSAVDFSQFRDWFGFSLGGYNDGETLSDLGAVGGSWGEHPVPEHATAVINIDGTTTNVVISTKAAAGSIVFTANRGKWSSGRLFYRCVASFTEADTAYTLSPDSKAGFTVVRPDGASVGFYGYTADGWVRLELPSASVTPAFDRNFDFLIGLDTGRVSYYLLTSGGEYEQLVAADGGAADFKAGGEGSPLNRVELQGEGSISDFDGKYRSSRLTLKVRQ